MRFHDCASDPQARFDARQFEEILDQGVERVDVDPDLPEMAPQRVLVDDAVRDRSSDRAQ